MSPLRTSATCKPASTAAQITGAATAIFLKEGYEAASMDAIARHADVSKATLYAHFSNKETLFAAVMKAQREEYERQLGDLSGDRDADFSTRLMHTGTKLVTYLLSPSKLRMFRVVIAENERIPEICQNFLKAGREHAHQRLAEIFRDGINSGQLKEHDCDEAARLFNAALRGDLVWSALLGPQHRPSDAEIDMRVSVVVKAMITLYAHPENLRNLDKSKS